jgi:hypothetical protein
MGLIAGAAAIAVLMLIVLILSFSNRLPFLQGAAELGETPLEPVAVAEPTPTPTPTPAPMVGYVTHCLRPPTFIQQLGMGQQPLIGTSARGFVGFVVIDPQTGEGYQDPSWDDAGYLGAYAYTERGDFYVAPAPQSSLELNPPEKQNILHRIDSSSAQLAPFVELPAALPVSANNPFGILGMAYDCDTGSLYASSVAGSTPTEEAGRIFQISATTGEILGSLDGIDAFGVGVFNTAEGKRLYYGKARSAELYSLPLDNEGRFAGEPRLEFSTTAFPDGDNRKIRRVVFTPENQMVLYAIDFDFTLRVASVIENTVYRFTYPADGGEWTFVSVEREER